MFGILCHGVIDVRLVNSIRSSDGRDFPPNLLNTQSHLPFVLFIVRHRDSDVRRTAGGYHSIATLCCIEPVVGRDHLEGSGRRG